VCSSDLAFEVLDGWAAGGFPDLITLAGLLRAEEKAARLADNSGVGAPPQARLDAPPAPYGQRLEDVAKRITDMLPAGAAVQGAWLKPAADGKRIWWITFTTPGSGPLDAFLEESAGGVLTSVSPPAELGAPLDGGPQGGPNEEVHDYSYGTGQGDTPERLIPAPFGIEDVPHNLRRYMLFPTADYYADTGDRAWNEFFAIVHGNVNTTVGAFNMVGAMPFLPAYAAREMGVDPRTVQLLELAALLLPAARGSTTVREGMLGAEVAMNAARGEAGLAAADAAGMYARAAGLAEAISARTARAIQEGWASVSHAFRVAGQAADPMRNWRLNKGGARVLNDALDMYKKFTERLPKPELARLREDVVIKIDSRYTDVPVPEGREFFPQNEIRDYAQYFERTGEAARGQEIRWFGDIVKEDGKITILLNPNVLKSDEAVVAVLSHEMFELNKLEVYFAKYGGVRTGEQLAGMVNRGVVGNFHSAAWDFADRMTDFVEELMRRGLWPPQ